METFEKVKIAVKALDSKKGFDIKVIKIDDVSILGDYFIIASGNTSTQVRALTDEVDEKMSQQGIEPGHVEGRSSGWILLDYCGVVVHIFTRDTRDYYNLDRMWSDGEKIDLDSILTSAREE